MGDRGAGGVALGGSQESRGVVGVSCRDDRRVLEGGSEGADGAHLQNRGTER